MLRSPLPEPPEFDVEARAAVWRALLSDRVNSSFILFSYGTCVICADQVEDKAAAARRVLQQYGHPVVGTPSADMAVYSLPGGDFVLGGGHPDMFTYVPAALFGAQLARDLKGDAAILGRTLRDMDAFALTVVYPPPTDQS